MTAPQAVKKLHSCLIACVGATIGRPPTCRRNAFSGTVFLQGKRARASNARPYKRFSEVWTRNISGSRTVLSPHRLRAEPPRRGGQGGRVFRQVAGRACPAPTPLYAFHSCLLSSISYLLSPLSSLFTLFRCSPCPKPQSSLHNKRSPLWKK